MVWDILQMVLPLIGVLGLMLLLLWFIKRINGGKLTASGGQMNVVDRINLTKDASLLVVVVSGKLMMLGVTPANISLITELDLSEEEYTARKNDGKATGMSFGAALQTVLKNKIPGAKTGNLPENDESYCKEKIDNDSEKA